jgi:23S rRNA (uridine2552-2'-O)-methyltransferase
MGKFIPKDTFFRKAKQDGYRARSAYKLKEALDKFHIIKKGDKVLDIGCAPGSFMQVISGIIGQEGKVIGLDILPLKPFSANNAITVTCDIRNIRIQDMLNEHALEHFDVVTCDIAPNLTGIREVDNKNVEELYHAVYGIMLGGLKKGGDAFLKSFFSDSFSDISLNLKSLFKKVTVFKPAASRSASSEIFLVCIDKKYGCLQQD